MENQICSLCSDYVPDEFRDMPTGSPWAKVTVPVTWSKAGTHALSAILLERELSVGRLNQTTACFKRELEI